MGQFLRHVELRVVLGQRKQLLPKSPGAKRSQAKVFQNDGKMRVDMECEELCSNMHMFNLT